MLAGALERAGHGEGKGLTQFLGPTLPPESTQAVEFLPPPNVAGEPLVKGEVKTLILTDLHVPCHDDKLIDAAIEADGDADQLVIGGDVLDVDQINPHGAEFDACLRDEYNYTLGRILEWSLMFKKVFVLPGNHDKWPNKWKKKRMPAAIHFLMSTLIDNLVAGRQFGDTTGKQTACLDMPNVYGDGGTHGWWVQIGDCVIAHPDSFYVKPGETVRRTLKYFHRRMEDVCACIIGHTHMLWEEAQHVRSPNLSDKHTEFPPDWLAIECGCLCKHLNYTMSGRLNYQKPRQPGYAVLYQTDGVTDFDKTRYVDLSVSVGDA
jgi:predicted phosphodiesterase